MKKLLSVLLCAAMLLTLFACGKKSEPEAAPSEAPVVSTVPEPEITRDPYVVHVERTPEPERTPAPAATPAPGSASAATPTPAIAQPVGTPVVTTPTPQPVQPEAAPSVPDVAISSGSAVYSIVDQAGTYTDALGNTYSYHYKVPAFGCTGPDTELLSEELYNSVMPIINAELVNMQSGGGLNVTRTDYASYANGRYVSVLCTIYYSDGSNGYRSVTLNTDTGFRATASELMQYTGVSEADFASLASQAAGNKFIELYGQPADDAAYQAYNSTISVSGAVLFINSGGRLSFPAGVYSPSGDLSYYIVSI